MASRLICKTLKHSTPIRTRGYATEAKQAAEHFPEESFGGNIWRNSLIAVIAGVAWYRIDQHITNSGDEKHPFTKWIEYHMTKSEENDQVAQANLAAAHAVQEYKLFAQDAQRAPIYRIRYTEAFERHSPRGLSAGTQVDLSDLKIRSD